MSSFLLNRYVGPAFDEERFEQIDRLAKWLFEVDNAPEETGFRSKLKRMWKRTRNHSVVKKVVAGSKSFLSRLTSRLTPDATPPKSDYSGGDSGVRTTEQVCSDQHVSESSRDCSDGASTVLNTSVTSSRSKPFCNFVPDAAPASTSRSETSVHHTSEDFVSGTNNSDQYQTSVVRYKEEEVGKQQDFPEIAIGVVSSRVKWLEPVFSGERVPVQALEMHQSGELALDTEAAKDDEIPNGTESDNDSVFDDSPRLFKHRLPAEEPEPWVEPGTVAKGAMWLQPIMSGERRASSGGDDQQNVTSPTRVSHGVFR